MTTVTEVESLTEAQVAFVAGLREMASFLEAHPRLINEHSAADLNVFAWTPEEMADLSREMGNAEKFEVEHYIGLRKMFGPHSIDLNVSRSKVCERVQVGTERVERTVNEDEVPEGAIVVGHVPVEVLRQVVIEEDVPVYEVKCPESFLALGETA